MVLYKEFKVGDLFRLKSIRQIPRGFVPELKEDGEYPYLTQKTGGSYGVNGYMDETDELELIEEPMIVTGVDNVANGVMYWWDKPFYANKMLGLINENLNRERAQYIITVLLKMYMGFDYNNKINMKIVRETVIQLPVKSLEDTEPDWEYMGDYIKQKELAYTDKLNLEFEQKKEQLIELIGEESEHINIEELPTAKFKIGDLFTVESTKSLDAGKLTFKKEGINFVGRTGANNGVQGKIGRQEFEPNEPNTITATVIGNLKYVKYQQEYYYTSQNINKMTPKYNMGIQHIQYFITHIKKFVEQYNGMQGGYKLEDIREHEIEVLVNPEVSDLVPDWETMEKYIARVELQLLNRVINTLNK